MWEDPSLLWAGPFSWSDDPRVNKMEKGNWACVCSSLSASKCGYQVIRCSCWPGTPDRMDCILNDEPNKPLSHLGYMCQVCYHSNRERQTGRLACHSSDHRSPPCWKSTAILAALEHLVLFPVLAQCDHFLPLRHCRNQLPIIWHHYCHPLCILRVWFFFK